MCFVLEKENVACGRHIDILQLTALTENRYMFSVYIFFKIKGFSRTVIYVLYLLFYNICFEPCHLDG